MSSTSRIANSNRGGGFQYLELTRASGAGWHQLKWRQEQEREWEGNLRSLQQCIGELLITSRELRNPPPSTTNHRYREPDNEYDSNVARNRS
jgi:hypothetical protein